MEPKRIKQNHSVNFLFLCISFRSVPFHSFFFCQTLPLFFPSSINLFPLLLFQILKWDVDHFNYEEKKKYEGLKQIYLLFLVTILNFILYCWKLWFSYLKSICDFKSNLEDSKKSFSSSKYRANGGTWWHIHTLTC